MLSTRPRWTSSPHLSIPEPVITPSSRSCSASPFVKDRAALCLTMVLVLFCSDLSFANVVENLRCHTVRRGHRDIDASGSISDAEEPEEVTGLLGV